MDRQRAKFSDQEKKRSEQNLEISRRVVLRMVDDKSHPSSHHSMKDANFWDISDGVCATAKFVKKADFHDSLKMVR